ncbi:hypothetical protein L596_006906 [Steinernema carpocapsae]|uniref:HEAT repeat-containing protein 1 n=1 Tax=Steinernema carpocapsae TaxID=34508 RepID=A0A4U5P8A9_STECR|nr:hypothetical protein L596_006906 [Steinernema carpocapsae]
MAVALPNPNSSEKWFDLWNKELNLIRLEFSVGSPALEHFSKLLQSTKDLLADDSNVDREGVLSLAAVSSAVLFTEIKKQPQLRPALSSLFRFVALAFSSAGDTEIAFKYVERLLKTLTNSSDEAQSECIDAIAAVVGFACSNRVLLEQLFQPEHRALVGVVYVILLNTFSKGAVDPSVRIKAGETMLRLCEPEKSLCATSFLLPGVSDAVVKVACALDVKNYKITLMALKIFKQFVTLTLGSNKSDADLDEKWVEKSVERIIQMVVKVSNRLTASSDNRIRESLLQTVCGIREKCKERFGSKLHEVVTELLVNLCVDPYESVCSEANKKLETFRENHNDVLLKFLTTRLNRLSSSLPYAVEKALSGEPLVLDRVHSVLRALGKKDLERVISCSPQFVAQFLDGLAASIRIDMKRLKINSESDWNNYANCLCLYPLKFSVTPKHLHNIANELMKAECSGIVFEHIVDRISADTYKKDKIGYFLIAACFLRAGGGAMPSYFEATLKTLRKLVNSIEAEVKDDKVEDLQRSHSDDSCLAAIALTALGEAMAQVDPSSEQFEVQLLNVLYDVLQFRGSTNYVVKEATEHALANLAKNHDTSVSSLLLRFAPFIVHRLDVQSRDFFSNRRSPLVLIQLLELCKDPSLYGHVRFIITDLVNALDRFNQEWTMLILKALLSFVQVVPKWFPDLKPSDPNNQWSFPEPKIDGAELDSDDEDNEDVESAYPEVAEKKEEVPKPIASVAEVLSRTKHMISSPHLPINVLVMEILEASLNAMKNFENQLLPMIHQNWLGLVCRLKLPWDKATPEQLISATRGLSIVVTMARLSGTFVYRKVMEEFWPSVSRFMVSAANDSRKTDMAYSRTYAFRYQKEVIKSCKPLTIHFELKTEKERAEILKILKIYADDEAQNKLLREEAERVLDFLDNFA